MKREMGREGGGISHHTTRVCTESVQPFSHWWTSRSWVDHGRFFIVVSMPAVRCRAVRQALRLCLGETYG